VRRGEIPQEDPVASAARGILGVDHEDIRHQIRPPTRTHISNSIIAGLWGEGDSMHGVAMGPDDAEALTFLKYDTTSLA